jgi:hypothetical protein
VIPAIIIVGIRSDIICLGPKSVVARLSSHATLILVANTRMVLRFGTSTDAEFHELLRWRTHDAVGSALRKQTVIHIRLPVIL